MPKKTKPALKQVSDETKKVVEPTKAVRGYRLRSVQIYLIGAIGVFLALSILAHRINYFPIDLKITRGIQQFNPLWFDSLMRFVTNIGYHPAMTIIMGLVALILLLIGLWWEALIGVFAWGFAGYIVTVIKDLINRPRPSFELVKVITKLGDPSFPSGHVVTYTVFFGYLWFLAFILLKKSLLRNVFLIVFGGLVLLVGPSRVYHGAHWASDTAAAYILGSVILLITIFIYRWGKNRFFKKQPVATEIKEV